MITIKINKQSKYFASLIARTSLFSICALSASAAFAAGELYRYVGTDGEVVIDDNIPPEFVSKGYAVLNKSGFVIEKLRLL